jgi:hypothetical protein
MGMVMIMIIVIVLFSNQSLRATSVKINPRANHSIIQLKNVSKPPISKMVKKNKTVNML